MELSKALKMIESIFGQLIIMYEDENVYSNMLSPVQWEEYKKKAEKAVQTILKKLNRPENTYTLTLTEEEWDDLERIMDNEQRIQEDESEFTERGPSPFLKSFFYMAYHKTYPKENKDE